jgi:hypothetical protein
MIEIEDEFMTLTAGDEVFANARFSRHAVASGDRAWIVSCHAARLFTRDQAITAMVIAERLAAGYGDDAPFTSGRHEELDT